MSPKYLTARDILRLCALKIPRFSWVALPIGSTKLTLSNGLDFDAMQNRLFTGTASIFLEFQPVSWWRYFPVAFAVDQLWRESPIVCVSAYSPHFQYTLMLRTGYRDLIFRIACTEHFPVPLCRFSRQNWLSALLTTCLYLNPPLILQSHRCCFLYQDAFLHFSPASNVFRHKTLAVRL